MGDFSEFRQHWRPLLAAFLGMGSALSLNSYILSIFAPYLIGEFGWTRSQWAMLGITQILIMVCMPVAGRLTDMFGVKPVASVGAVSFPVFLVAIAMMNGNIFVYLAIYIGQTILCSTTTATVYSRLVAAAFSNRRGLALGICGSSPPLISAAASPLITAFVEDHGWRAGYLAVAAFCAVCTVITLLLIPRSKPSENNGRQPVRDRAIGVYRAIFAMPVFWIIFAAVFLSNLPFSLAISQLKLVVLDQGLSDATAAILVSTFAIGSIVGRVFSGAALDYLPANVIASICFGLPFFGLLMLASPFNSVAVVTTAILLIGLSFGGEGDIVPYLVTRYFGISVFSTVFGLLTAAIGSAMALGNGLLGLTLDTTGSFDLYLLVAAAGAFIGSALFLLLGRARYQPAASPPAD
ncbi:MAG: MFS transporter [Novosphingobium sp.]|nr:MFS transporter [Novosphingobium sp.]MCP5404120.1 MFS transporter [Novosphingobium sp.]